MTTGMNDTRTQPKHWSVLFVFQELSTRLIRIKTYSNAHPNYMMNDSTTTSKVIKVRLELHAQNLKNVAGFGGKSDPFAIVTLISNQPNVKPTILGKTEVYVVYLPFIFYALIMYKSIAPLTHRWLQPIFFVM